MLEEINSLKKTLEAVKEETIKLRLDMEELRIRYSTQYRMVTAFKENMISEVIDYDSQEIKEEEDEEIRGEVESEDVTREDSVIRGRVEEEKIVEEVQGVKEEKEG